MTSVRDAGLLLGAVLDSMGIAFAIGGSFASSVHGIARSTQDLDFIAAILPGQVETFVAAVEKDFYVDAEAIREAMAHRRAFNVIHFATGLKIDIFPASSHPLGAPQLQRRGPAASFPVISAEDTILVKLCDGGETSERQWNDLRNVVKVQGERLDRDYLRVWSRELGVSDLLVRLLSKDTE